MTPGEIMRFCEGSDIRLARFLYCDNGGVIRGKTTGMAGLESRLQDGIGLTVAMMAMSSLDQLQPVEGMGPVGEIRLVPDLDSFGHLPYARHSAGFQCDMIRLDGQPWEACTRSFLKRMRQKAAAMGYTLQAAVEAEFSLATKNDEGRYIPFDRTLCFSSIAMQMADGYVDSLVEALQKQGMTVEQYYPELGHGQHEISIHHAEALTAADNHLKLRETIRGVAWQQGLYTSLAPKPWPDAAGNGGHIHFSLWKGRQNAFYDAAVSDGLSQVGRRFLAGVLSHLPGLLALTCPSVNSYRRLQPRSWSSAFAVYGHDNREAALRIASPFRSNPNGTLNMELKAADSSNNPYLALGALLAAGLDGVERELEPGSATEIDPAALTEEEQRQRGIRRLPSTLEEALAALEADSVLTNALGPVLYNAYRVVRQSEVDAYQEVDERTQFESHFYKY